MFRARDEPYEAWRTASSLRASPDDKAGFRPMTQNRVKLPKCLPRFGAGNSLTVLPVAFPH
jgi:hypothetical protein